MDKIQLAQDREHWRSLVDTVIKKPSGSFKGPKSSNQLRYYQLLMNDFSTNSVAQ